MYDDVYIEADLPPGHPDAERAFQTKSLLRCLDRFTITKEGRLMLHACRYEPPDGADGTLPLLTRTPTGDIDTEFHGDIRLTSTIENRFIEYAAPFTHGTLESIRPWSELSEIQQALLTP
jgi:hypothetical protein